jgi:hypothetical protein
MFKSFRPSSVIPAHKYAGEVDMAGSRHLTVDAAPFRMTAAPGTRNRVNERMQAHKNRMQLMKFEHTQAKKKHAEFAKAHKQHVSAVARKQQAVQTARAKLAAAKTERGKDTQRRRIETLKAEIQALVQAKNDHNTSRAMYAKKLKAYERSIAKENTHLRKNTVKRRALKK